MVQGEDTTAKLTRAGLNLIQQALSIYDSELRLAACNPRFQEMFDLPDWIVTPGARFEDTIRFLVERGEYGPVGDSDEAVRVRVEAARTFRPHYMERPRPNGRWIGVEGSPLPQGGWVTVYTDITEIKYQERLLRARAEDLAEQLLADRARLAEANRALAATNAALEESRRELAEMEARTRLTTEMMPAHIAHVGRDLRYTYSNRRLSSMLPGRRSEIVGLHGRDALGETAFARIAPRLEAALAGEASVFEFTDADSGRRIRVAFTPDAREGGEVQGVYILSMDVTEEAQARAALAQGAKRELAAQLTSGLAHDFSNLLTIILGLQGRLQRMDLPAEARGLAEATAAAARRGGGLLDRLASISGPRALRPAPVRLPAFLEDLRMLAAPSLPAGMALEMRCTGLAAPVMLDAGALQDSLLNLILNARDAIAGGPGGIVVTARAVRDTWLEIVVADEGPGFSEEALRRGLEPFFTTKGGAGSGLGLAMVFDQTRLAGGTVRLANRPAGGAAVTLRLPLRVAAAEEDAPGVGRLVLLVEDSAEIRTGIREMLTGLGHSVIEAAGAEEALALAAMPEIGLVLSDIRLAGDITGLALAERLRAAGCAAEIRLMTSLPPGDGLRRRAAAAFPLLGKPFEVGELAAFLAPERAA